MLYKKLQKGVLNQMTLQTIEQPNLDLSKIVIPTVRIKSLKLENYKVFEDVTFSFDKNNEFACFYGPNGCGKTTVLDAIQLVFSNLEGYDKTRMVASLGKAVRHTDNAQQVAIYESNSDDFLITAEMVTDINEYPSYTVKVNKSGFLEDHPEEIKQLSSRLCFYAKFDQELHQFQLFRDKWESFQYLFKNVTGFEVEEQEHVDLFFDPKSDPYMNNILRKYVLNFIVKKPDEVISHKECSAGEKKIIKCFSTLLNQEAEPEIILIDNVAMHVESGRHIDLIRAIKKCFENSQIFSTTHSYHISRNFGARSQLYDLRIIKANKILREEPWRFHMIDEAKDMLIKLRSLNVTDAVKEKYEKCGKTLICTLENDELSKSEKNELCTKFKKFLSEIDSLYVDDISEHTFTQIKL